MSLNKNYLLFLLGILLIQSCSSIDKITNDWKNTHNIKESTGVFVGKFDLNLHWKNKNVIAFLTDSKYHNNIVAYDTISPNGYVILKNIPQGTYFLNMNDRIYGKDTVSYNYLDYLQFSFDDCYFFYLDILTDTITYTEVKAPGKRIMQSMPMILPNKFTLPPEEFVIKDSCKLNYDILNLNEVNYIFFDSLNTNNIIHK